jgi:hypothetical protein
MAAVFAPAFPTQEGSDLHCLQVGKYLSRFAIKKKSGSTGLRSVGGGISDCLCPRRVAVFQYRALS